MPPHYYSFGGVLIEYLDLTQSVTFFNIVGTSRNVNSVVSESVISIFSISWRLPVNNLLIESATIVSSTNVRTTVLNLFIESLIDVVSDKDRFNPNCL